VFGASVPDPNIFGNVYIAGSIPISDTPLSIKGSAVIDLGVDVNGNVSGLNRSTGDALLKGQMNLMALTKTLSVKPRIGVNGELDVGVDLGGGAVTLGVKAGTASAFYIPNYVNPSPGPTDDEIILLQHLNASGLTHVPIPTFPT